MGRPFSPLVERFVGFTEAMPSGCVEWQGHGDHDGYGVFWMNGRNNRAHRAAWLIFVGTIPEGHVVHHMCRNRGCVNPMHLTTLTHSENVSERRSCHCGTCVRCVHTDYMRTYLGRPDRAEINRRRMRAYKAQKRAAHKGF